MCPLRSLQGLNLDPSVPVIAVSRLPSKNSLRFRRPAPGQPERQGKNPDLLPFPYRPEHSRLETKHASALGILQRQRTSNRIPAKPG